MAGLVTTYSEKRQVQLALALILFDQFTGKRELIGDLEVRLAGKPNVKPFAPYRKEPEATFLFFDLPAGAYIVEVRSGEHTPYYADRDIPITLPMPNPLWPAFPDVTLADESKPLDAPTQPVAYRTQRAAATLRPTAAYPFPEGTTLARGTVRSGVNPLSQATVQHVGQDVLHVTGENGEYALYFPKINGTQQTVTLRATHSLHAAVDKNVVARRGVTVTQDFDLP